MKITEAQKKAGHFGIFQKLAMVILAFSSAFGGFQTSSSNFISGNPESWCKVRKLANFSFEQQKNIAIPFDSEGEYDSCRVFDLDWENYTTEQFVNWSRSDIEDSTNTVPCDEYVYSQEVFLKTANTRWHLFCSNSIVGEMISTVYVLGIFIGSVSSGRFSDSLGRRFSMIIYCIILTAVLYTAGYMPNVWVFLVLRFLVGIGTRGTNTSASVLMIELSGPSQREFAGTLVPSFFAIGVMVSSGVGYFLRDYQLIHMVMGAIGTSILISCFLMPESPRWLLVNGKVEKAEKTLKWIGEVNGNPLPEDFTLEQEDPSKQQTANQVSYFDLFRQPVLRKHILIMHFLWVAANFSQIAMTLNLGTLTGDAYLNVFLSGATELPACIIILFVMKKMGRKHTFVIFGLIFTACNAIAVPFELLPDLRIVASVFTILARAASSALLCDLRVLTAELFPTPLRQRVLGAVTGLAAAIGISGPYLGGSLREVWRPLSNVIFGSLGLMAVILALFLPDTRGHGLPDTMEAAIAIGEKKEKPELSEDSLSSVSISVEDPKESKLNGVMNPVFVNGESNDSATVDPDNKVAYF